MPNLVRFLHVYTFDKGISLNVCKCSRIIAFVYNREPIHVGAVAVAFRYYRNRVVIMLELNIPWIQFSGYLPCPDT